MSLTWSKTYPWNLHTYSSYHYKKKKKNYNKVSVIRILITGTLYNSIVFLCPYKVFIRQFFIIQAFPNSKNYLRPWTDQVSESSLYWKHIFCSRSLWRSKLNCLWCFSFLLNMKTKVTGISTSKLSEFFSGKIHHFENMPWRRKLNNLWCFSFSQNMKIMSNSKVIGLSVHRISQNFRKNPLFLKSAILRVPHTFRRDMWLKILLTPWKSEKQSQT